MIKLLSILLAVSYILVSQKVTFHDLLHKWFFLYILNILSLLFTTLNFNATVNDYLSFAGFMLFEYGYYKAFVRFKLDS